MDRPCQPLGSSWLPLPARTLVVVVIVVSRVSGERGPGGVDQPLGSSVPPLPARTVVLLVMVRSSD
jgi:hypothetical protein